MSKITWADVALVALIGGVVVFGMANCTEPAEKTYKTRSEIYDGYPPPEFRNDVVATRVIFTTDVAGECRKLGLAPVADTVVNSCEKISLDGSTREMVLLNPCLSSGKYAKDACHGIGHLNFWSYDHPR